MKPIILASQSPQRRKLLKLLDIPFTVKPSDAEEISVLKGSVSKLVKDNAWIKASDVALQLKEGVVIGSDTVVYGNRRLILKPKDLKEAKKELKLLMKTPHWVYSGICVIDVASGKTLVEYDRTRVYMNKLTDKEIDAYHAKMSPLDKAGGFDIEGLGSGFIHRIEGCYFNVVGLPLAKLTQMLKEVGVNVLLQ